tara:strand:- start:195 stop:464 length:270 start_codon:yes stop_codon:yes gene_type:complete
VDFYYWLRNLDVTVMNVNLGLLDYMPLPQMAFDKVVPEWPSAQRVEETAKAIDEKVQKYKYTDAYAYHPQNMNKGYPHRIGENVDMVIW